MAILTTNEQINLAVRQSKANLRGEVTALAVKYAPNVDAFVLELSNHTRCIFPREQLQGLQEASRRQLTHVEIVGAGSGLHWPDLDVDLSVEGLRTGVYGTKEWMSDLGRLGGSKRSKAKAEAARLNGLKGGRPKLADVRAKR